MSSRICGKCGSHKVVDAGSYAGSSFFKCETCGQLGMREKFPEMTVFHKITAFPETLAEKFVNEAYDMSGDKFRYYSCLTKEFYDNEKEAIAATLTKLKEEIK